MRARLHHGPMVKCWRGTVVNVKDDNEAERNCGMDRGRFGRRPGHYLFPVRVKSRVFMSFWCAGLLFQCCGFVQHASTCRPPEAWCRYQQNLHFGYQSLYLARNNISIAHHAIFCHIQLRHAVNVPEALFPFAIDLLSNAIYSPFTLPAGPLSRYY